MTGYILKTDNEECKDNIDISTNRTIYKDIETGKHYIRCHGCEDGNCMVEVDILYAISPSVSKMHSKKQTQNKG